MSAHGIGQGPRTLAPGASQRFVYREFTQRVIIFVVVVRGGAQTT